MTGWGSRLRALLRRSVEERELDEEIRFHLEMEASKLEREGLSPSQARREALVRFGGVERMKERTRDERGTRGAADVMQDLRYGWRTLRRSPAFTLTAVLTVALGVGATTVAFSLVEDVLLRPFPYARADRLVEIRELGDGRIFYPSYPNFDDWRTRSTSFSEVVAVQAMGAQPVSGIGDPVRAPVVAVSRDYLSTLGVRPFLGRDFTADENAVGGPAVALVSHAFWETRLGADSDLESLSFTVYGDSYRVVGVLPPGFRFVYDADVLIPADRWPGTVRSSHAYRVFGRLEDHVTLEVARQEMNALTAAMAAEYGDATQARSARLTPLEDVLVGPYRRALGLLLGASVLVLLVACANVSSTLLARGAARVREMAVRSSLGAGRARLARQLFTESALVAFLGGVVGTALAWLGIGAVARYGPSQVPRLEAVSLDGRVLGFAIGALVVSVVLFGLFPAAHVAGNGISRGLRGGDRGASGRRARMWDVLLAGEVGLAVVLVTGAGVLLHSLIAIMSLPLGWDPRGVLEMTLTLPEGAVRTEDEGVALYRRIGDALRALPAVQEVGAATFGPLDAGNWTAPVREAGTEARMDNYTGWRLVDPRYFATLAIPVVRGRLFTEDETDVAVVNESLARFLWGDADPIGRRVISNYDTDGDPVEVVGVVADARDWRWPEGDQLELFVPWWDHPSQAVTMRFFLRTDDAPRDLVEPARQRLRELAPTVPVEFETLDGDLSASTADRRFVAGVLMLFAGASLVLALVGIFGVVAYSVAQRRREIGIRIALGAGAARVRGSIRAEALRPTAVGVLAGVGVALATGGVLDTLLYDGVPARDPWMLGGVVLLFVAAAYLASDLPARTITRLDPVTVFKEE